MDAVYSPLPEFKPGMRLVTSGVMYAIEYSCPPTGYNGVLGLAVWLGMDPHCPLRLYFDHHRLSEIKPKLWDGHSCNQVKWPTVDELVQPLRTYNNEVIIYVFVVENAHRMVPLIGW